MEIEVTDDIRVAPESKNMIRILSEAFEKRTPIDINGKKYMVVAKSNSVFSMRRVESVKAAEWAGEGLPPVGAVCERNYGGEWKKTTVCGHSPDGKSWAAFYDDDKAGWLGAAGFRPIRTPDQIAAEAKEAAITVIENRIMARMGDLNVRNLAEDLHALLQEMAVKP